MEDVTIIRVFVGRKTFSFSVPDQATDFFSPNDSEKLNVTKEGASVMVFNKWDRLEVVRGNGAVV